MTWAAEGSHITYDYYQVSCETNARETLLTKSAPNLAEAFAEKNGAPV